MTETTAKRRNIFLGGRSTGYPDAVVAGGLIFTSGARPEQDGLGFDDLPEKGRSKQQGYPLVDDAEGRVSASAWGAHQTLENILAQAGSDNSQILRQHVWQKDKRFFPCYERQRIHWQPSPSPSSGLGVSAIPGGDHWIALDAIAVAPGDSELFGRREVVVGVEQSQLPSASHYSQAVRSGPLVFTAGHIPIKTNEPGKPLVQGFDDVPPEGRSLATGRSHPDSRDGPIAAQTWYCYFELKGLLERSNFTFDDVILSTVYLSDPRDFAVFHRVHREIFGAHEPALAISCFDEVGHRGCRIEIELTVLDPTYGIKMKSIPWTGTAPYAAPAGMAVGPFVFMSGMVGHDEKGRLVMSAADLPEAAQWRVDQIEGLETEDGLAAQTYACFARLEEACKAAGGSLKDVVKLSVYLKDEIDMAVFEAVRAIFIADADLPAAEFVLIHGPGPLTDSVVQIEAIAHIA